MFQTKDKNKEHKNSRERVKKHLVLTKRLWIFLVLGAVVSILGLIIGGIYFNVLSITTSSELTEILPTYILCLLYLYKVEEAGVTRNRTKELLQEKDVYNPQ